MGNASKIGPTCLVVGGAGFVGRALVKRLQTDGLTVRSFDISPAFDADSGVDERVGDLRDPAAVDAAVEGVQTIFHVAAMISLIGIARAEQRKMVMDVNVGGTRNLLESAARHGVKQFVYTSSNNVCFDREIIDGDETSAYATTFVDLYTESKVACENIVIPANGGAGVSTCALRPGGIWGPGPGSYMVEKFIEQLATGRLVATIGEGTSVADNTHVDNLVDAQVLSAIGLAERPEVVGGQAYFITDDEPMNPVEWFRPLTEALGYTMPSRKLPGGLMYALGYLMEWLHFLGGPRPVLTRVEVLKVTRSHSFRIDKARKELGYAPAVTVASGYEACLPHARSFIENHAG